MANANYIPTGFQQSGDICLLASYSAVLGYYQNVIYGYRSNNIVDELLLQYIKYMNHLLCDISNEYISSKVLGERLIQLEQAIIVELKSNPKNFSSIRRLYENYISIVLHWYCQSIRSTLEHPNGIHGYLHVKEFDEYLVSQGCLLRSNNFQIKTHEEQESPIPKAYEIIKEHLDNAEHNIAMLLYKGIGGFHSIMVAQDKDGIIYRDSNQRTYCRKQATFEFQFNEQSQIWEYILFQLSDHQ